MSGIKTGIEELLTMKLAAKSKHDANVSLSYWKLFVCVFMSAVWFKIISRTHYVIGNYLFVFYVSCVVQNYKQNRHLHECYSNQASNI